ncbi:hypothetical protein D3C74_274620 [compost metagenome]
MIHDYIIISRIVEVKKGVIDRWAKALNYFAYLIQEGPPKYIVNGANRYIVIYNYSLLNCLAVVREYLSPLRTT